MTDGELLFVFTGDDSLGAMPLLQGSTFGVGHDFSFPKFSIEQQANVGTNQPFAFSFRQRSLADLRDVILDPDHVRLVVAVDVLNAQLAAQDRFAELDIRAADLAAAGIVALAILFHLFRSGAVDHDIDLKTPMVVVVYGHAPGQVTAMLLARRFKAGHVGPAALVGVHPTVGEGRADIDAPVGFFGVDFYRNFDGLVGEQFGLPVREGNMNGIVFHVDDEIAGARVSLDPDLTAQFEIGVARKVRCLAVADISEDQPQIFSHRIGSQPHGFRRRFIFGRNLHALTAAVVLPAVKAAANAVAFDPTDRELQAAMGATKRRQMRRAALATIERKLFAENLNRLRLPRF